MGALADRTLGQFLEQVAAESPSPGGGSSCALACAVAAGLVEMAAAFTLARDEYAERHERMAAVRERAGELRARALELAEEELHSYAAVLAVLREPAEAPGRAERLDAALSDAADSPLAVARAGAEVAELAAETARDGNRNLRGDAVAGAVLAEAACTAAARLAEINLARRPQDPRRSEASEPPERARRARVAALSSTHDV
jgi:methenyltetrahydrofolate cyclohydrolase